MYDAYLHHMCDSPHIMMTQWVKHKCEPAAADVDTLCKPQRSLRRHSVRQECLKHGAPKVPMWGPAALQQDTK
jgi:hypothetical protein